MLQDLDPSAPTDFDFFIGDWRVLHERLNSRLNGCTEWTHFEGQCSTRTILGGWGNTDDNLLHLPSGPYRAATMRSFDAATGTWAIWWLDGRLPHSLDVPVRGAFEDGIGRFYADDQLDGRPIRVRFTWFIGSDGHPRWEQAFSPDGGVSWETNWSMEFRRLEA
ncbi:MAG: DUF1579 domain-containing protein [Roseateles sp.]|jgi:hypothetical protein|nr:DUF1579 domain-containing protein [Methylibium sp.]MBY0366130.1 DUF1579 domain-containing protein [Burkholderiaceae bacterium]|mmetsp:Transcript_75030/g.176095  ORF Transcript_75030/g.176095 Transcript_75030/m.176095 type:complete len:164 (+) Transcript_75030:435-926(+)